MARSSPLTEEHDHVHIRGNEAICLIYPALSELPSLPAIQDPGPDPETYLNNHYTNTSYPPKTANPQATLKDLANQDAPLKADICRSIDLKFIPTAYRSSYPNVTGTANLV